MAKFLDDIFTKGGDHRRLLRRKFEELEAYSSTLPGVPYQLFAKWTSPPFAAKNRYRIILPLNDGSRVKLLNSGQSDSEEYINASYVGTDNRYIITQAPLKDATVDDFWRMVWQTEASCIVMLVKVDPRKADRYWPESVDECLSACDGRLTVTFVEECNVGQGLVKRMFRLECDSKDRMVTQYHYEQWPDHAPPTSFLAFHNLHSVIRADPMYAKSPSVIIHCSAGVGRTGTFVTIDACLKRLCNPDNSVVKTDPEDVDNRDYILAFIKECRRHRPWFVENEEQFIFCYEYIKWALERGKRQEDYVSESLSSSFS